jgi:uncharacterized protein YjaZ
VSCSNMKDLLFTLIFGLGIITTASAQQNSPDFVTTDIDNFWQAYDKIVATKDTVQQYQYLNQLFLDKATPGQKAMIAARRYTAKEYLAAITDRPQYWLTIRVNTNKAKAFASDIEANILKLKKLYPQARPAKIYFTVGVFRSGGTTTGDMVLIGSEIAFTDENLKNMVFTNVHEYVHTQEKTTDANTILGQSVLEGVAEYLAVKATGQPSSAPAIAYGYAHNDRIREVFAQQLFNTSYGIWMYNSMENEFNNTRDLGYYVGYAICEDYYNKAKNKQQAVKDMIELDYNDEAALAKFVDESGYFAEPIAMLKAKYEDSRPSVTSLKPFKNNATDVDPATTEITVEFSNVMSKRYRNFELGPLGKDNLLKIKGGVGFSEDGRSFTFTTELQPNRQYQLVLGRFRDKDYKDLKEYLINFKTAGK